MSIEAVSWALKVKGIKSSMKFVLVVLANHADATNMAWPSVASIVDSTNLDRKTVLKAIDCLEEYGFLKDTGKREGATKQVKIYRLCIEKNCVEESQKRNSPKNGTVPNFPSKSTVFPGKESQISAERVPNLGHGTVMEPSIEPSWNRQVECARDALPATVATEPEKIEPKKPERAKRKTRLPDDWFLPKEWGEWALAQGMLESEIREEADRFADHWRSNGEGKVDWLATWRNWVRRRRQFARIPAGVKRNEPESMESLLARSARDAEKLKHLFEKRK